MRFHRFAAFALLVALTLSARAQNTGKDVTLKPGDPAPALTVGKWVKGEPVKEFEKGKVYVIECWATWCGPCKVMMPHVTKLQKQYGDKGLVVIGVNVWEPDEAKVEPFVKEQGDTKMGYRVVLDEGAVKQDGRSLPAGKMATNWLKAAGRNGIPCSFVVDKEGKVAWVGHPMQMELPLKLCLEGKFDQAAVDKVDKRTEELSKQFQSAMREKKYDDAEKAVDELLTLAPAMGAFMGSAKLEIALRKGDTDRAHQLARAVLDGEETRNDMSSLGRTVSTLMQAGDPAKVDHKLVIDLATRAAEVDKASWQTEWLLARAYAFDQQWAKAVEHQTKAAQTAPDQVKPAMTKALDEYKSKQK